MPVRRRFAALPPQVVAALRLGEVPVTTLARGRRKGERYDVTVAGVRVARVTHVMGTDSGNRWCYVSPYIRWVDPVADHGGLIMSRTIEGAMSDLLGDLRAMVLGGGE